MQLPAQTFTYKHTSETELARAVLAFMGPSRVRVNPNDTNNFRVIFPSGITQSFESIEEFNSLMLNKGVYSPTRESFTPKAATCGRINWPVLQTL